MKGLRLGELTYEEAAAAVADYPVAVLPIGGGSKEHGPQLPCGTDQMVTDEMARQVVEACPILLLPTLAYAYYPAFVDWSGSVSIEPDHFTGMVGDIIRSMARHGYRKFLIIDGGVSTHPPLRTLSSQLHLALGVHVAVTNIHGLGSEVGREIAEQPSGGHADELETSCMLALRPDLVKMDRAVTEYSPTIPGMQGADGTVKVVMGGKMITPHGINGDATLATAEKGRKVLYAMALDFIVFLENFITWEPPAFTPPG
jgi:creatinine amidohydrolase